MIHYQDDGGNSNLTDIRKHEIMDAEYVKVMEVKNMDGNITACAVVIPYNNICIREIRLDEYVSDEDGKAVFCNLAERINNVRRAWLNGVIFDAERKNRTQGIETANDIEDGKVKQGFFGKLFRK